MSQRNKKDTKVLRRAVREATGLNKFPKQEPGIPWEVSSGILTDSKGKLTNTFRKHMLSSRDSVIEYPRSSVESAEAQVARKAKGMNMRQLCNAIARCPRRVRSCEQTLSTLQVPFKREPYEAALQYFWMLNTAVLTEHKRRTYELTELEQIERALA